MEDDIFRKATQYDNYTYTVGTDEFLIDYNRNIRTRFGITTDFNLYDSWYNFNDIFFDLSAILGKDKSLEFIEEKFAELLEECLLKIGFTMKIERFRNSTIIYIDPASRLKRYKEQFFIDAMEMLEEHDKIYNNGTTMISGEDDLREYILDKRHNNALKLSPATKR